MIFLQRLCFWLVLVIVFSGTASSEVVSSEAEGAVFPRALSSYDDSDAGVWAQLKSRVAAEPFNLSATIIFLGAIFHTFLAGVFKEWAHKHEEEHRQRIEREGRTGEAKPHVDAEDDVSFKSTILHFLGEVEVIFGIWVIFLAGAAMYHFGLLEGWGEFRKYVDHVDFTEPLFVVIIMALAASRPILRASEQILASLARLGNATPAAWWFAVMTCAPILGSFITEPAAMTIAALILAKKFYDEKPSLTFCYATLGLLYVNVSVGGTLTNFAAPPVLMVVGKWGWSTTTMLTHFGWKAVLAIVTANVACAWFFRKELFGMKTASKDLSEPPQWFGREDPIPLWVTLVHVGFMVFTVLNLHDPPLFIPAFLFFLAFVKATGHHQDNIDLKVPMLVGFFLAGLKIHGECQGWWIEPILTSGMSDFVLMLGATFLTAFNDNAAITFLAAQAGDNLAATAKYAVMAGAVAGGGLTVIANAPNPAGQGILQKYFPNGVSPIRLFLGAIIPTILVVVLFAILPPHSPDNTLNLRPLHPGESTRVDPGQEMEATPGEE